MTQALLPLPNIAISGAERCNSNEVEVPKIRECPGSLGHLGPKPEHLTRVEMGMVGESDLQPPKSKAEKIQEGLEKTISDEAKQRIENVLNEVNQLSDVEKLLLYLKLPTGSALFSAKDGTGAPSATPNRLETIQAATWIKSHLEEDVGTSLPKQEVFEDYKVYCESHGYKALSQADFGKAMKCVFPNVKARRLGQRGQSKHCYGGLRKKLCVKPPALPDLSQDEVHVEPKKEEESVACDEVVMAASDLVCEWSQKLLNHRFGNLKDLAVYLIDNMYVSSRSMAAFTIITSSGKGDPTKSGSNSATTTTPTNTLNRHRETQLQLQRKLQEREQIKEQKRKLEQQRSAMKSHTRDDSRSADDSSRESEKGDTSGDCSTSIGLNPLKIHRSNSESSKMKPHTPVTPQKTILPKIGLSQSNSIPIASQAKPVVTCTITGDTQTSVSSSVTINGNVSAPQQILVFSPTPHMSQPATQQLVILSPIGRGAAPMQHTNNQQAVPVQPVIMSTLSNQTQPPVTTQFAPKTVNVVQVPLLQTQVSSQSLPKGLQVGTTIQSQTEVPNKTTQLTTNTTDYMSCHSEQKNQTTPSSHLVPITHTNKLLQQSAVHAPNTAVPKVTQQLQQHKQHMISNQVLGVTTGKAMPQAGTVLQNSQTPLKLVTTSASPKVEISQASSNNSASKVASKTVSDLLKEQRGHGNGSDSKMPYVNDRRPVSELLKDIRAKKLFPTSTTVLAQALDPLSTCSISANNLKLDNVNKAGTSKSNVTATVSIDHNPRMTAPLPIISGTMLANNSTPEMTPISDNNNTSKTSSLQELLTKAENDLQTPVVNPTTTERLQQVLAQTGITKKRSLTTSDALPRKRQNIGYISQDTIQKTAASIIKNPELASALMAVSPLQSKVELIKLERQLSTSRSVEADGFASRLAISLAKDGFINQSEMIKELQNQQLQNQERQSLVKNELSKDASLSNAEKDVIVDIFASESAPELSDITPSIAQMVQNQANQHQKQSGLQTECVSKDESSNDSKSDGAYNLSEVLMKANVGAAQKTQIKQEESNSNQSLMFQFVAAQAQQQQQVQPQPPLPQPQSAPGSAHSTPCPSPGPSDPRQPFINLRGDVLLSQTATPKAAQIALLQKQLMLQNQQQQQQQKPQLQQLQPQQQPPQQRRHYHHQRQRHRSMPDQVLRQQISNINFSQPTIREEQKPGQTQADLFPNLALPPQQRTLMLTTMADGTKVQLQPHQLQSTSVRDLVQASISQQQVLTAAIQSNPTLTAQLLQNNMVLNLANQFQQQQQNMQELQQQQQQISNSGINNVAISGNTTNNGLVSLPQSPAQLMSPNSGSTQRSAASTPMSVLSPQTPMSHGMGHSRSIGPSPVEMTNNAFMPIQNLQLEGGDNVSLVRPTATIASSAAENTTANTTEQQLHVAESSSFQPYSTQPSHQLQDVENFFINEEKHTKPLNPNLLVRQKLAHKLAGLNMASVKETAHFAPASSIKPVKRGGRGTNKGAAGRRQRHHSAQSALGGPQSQGSTATLLRQRARNLLQAQTESQSQQPPQPISTSVLGDVNMGLGPSTPESPFSPEIQDILNSASQSSSGNTNLFRSQSVPVSDLFFDGDYGSSSDIFSGSTSMVDQQKETELIGDLSGSDISSLASLLQGKLQEENSAANRGLHSVPSEGFVARRNLTELIEQRTNAVSQDANALQQKTSQGNSTFSSKNTYDFDDSGSTQSFLGFRGRGDVTLTSASLCDNPQLQQMQGLSVVLPNTSSTSVSQSSNVIDFSAEVQNIVGQTSSGTHQVNRLGQTNAVGNMSTLDTPSSMDTMSTQDSRDSLADPLFQNTYDTGSDFTQNLGSGQSMDMVGSSDFNFPQWELSQMVHD